MREKLVFLVDGLLLASCPWGESTTNAVVAWGSRLNEAFTENVSLVSLHSAKTLNDKIKEPTLSI